MFRQRTSSQKPGDELLANFRQQFPEVAAVTSEATVPLTSQTTDADNPILTRGLHGSDQLLTSEALPDQDPTPRASNEPWRFTPSLLDPNSFAFNAFANNPPSFYTPTPGGTSAMLHSQAGDLHTPTLGMGHGLGTPLSMPTTDNSIHAGATGMDMSAFQALHPQQFAQFNPFLQENHQQSFAPSSFVHHDTGYETMEQDGTPMDSDPSEEQLQNAPPPMQKQQQPTAMQMAYSLPAFAEQFRFRSALNAPTAMIRHADEIPITYLNKGQAYSLSIADSKGNMPVVPGTKYRTFVRISFEEDQQRQKPGVCWTLWKEGRGTSEAHQRGGKLQAVEYVEAGQPVEGDDKKTRVELESSSFDGFSVIWTPGANGAPEVNIAVRFNFLSTDFSHSKGVKGIPVRLCAKTNLVAPNNSPPAPATAPEICFCKVKLFRDHGAERKLSNDIAHVKKSMDKLKQQIAQAESGLKDFGKKRRSSGVSRTLDTQRSGKVQKHRRTWSMSSASSAGGGVRTTLDEDMHRKLQTLQDMFSSTRPISVLFLRGEELDDPDLHPVSMQGDLSPSARATGQPDNLLHWQARSGHTSDTTSFVSPSPSSLSLTSQASATQWQNFESSVPAESMRNRPVKVKTDEEGALSGWIEALGVDPSYRPPPERKPKPVACFYIQRQGGKGPGQQEYYRAIYLMQRTLKELNDRVGQKWGIDATSIRRTIHVVRGDLEVEMDDDVVRELKEGQTMKLEIVKQQPPTKREWDIATDENDLDREAQGSPQASGWHVLRLVF